MFKRLILTAILAFGLAVPASAEVNGVYGGLKFIDSIQSTGSISRSGDLARGLMDSDYNQNTVGGGIFVGYDFFPQHQIPIRTEIEYAIRTNMNTSWGDSASGRVLVDGKRVDGKGYLEAEAQWNLQTLFFNAYWDFHNSSNFTPYIGAGLGMGFIQNKYKLSGSASGTVDNVPVAISLDDSLNETNTVFAWNAGLGCSYAFNENISADLAYRFVGLGYNENEKTILGQKQKIGMAPYANEFSLGVRFTF